MWQVPPTCSKALHNVANERGCAKLNLHSGLPQPCLPSGLSTSPTPTREMWMKRVKSNFHPHPIPFQCNTHINVFKTCIVFWAMFRVFIVPAKSYGRTLLGTYQEQKSPLSLRLYSSLGADCSIVPGDNMYKWNEVCLVLWIFQENVHSQVHTYILLWKMYGELCKSPFCIRFCLRHRQPFVNIFEKSSVHFQRIGAQLSRSKGSATAVLWQSLGTKLHFKNKKCKQEG